MLRTVSRNEHSMSTHEDRPLNRISAEDALARLSPHRTHESNWFKAMLCALGFHRWYCTNLTDLVHSRASASAVGALPSDCHARECDITPSHSVQGRGHGPTALTGADVNSIREPIAQKISTGRPSQRQRQHPDRCSVRRCLE